MRRGQVPEADVIAAKRHQAQGYSRDLDGLGLPLGSQRGDTENGALSGQAQITFRGRKDKEIKSSLLHSRMSVSERQGLCCLHQ